MFISLIYKNLLKINKKVIEGTPKKLCFFTTVQFIHQLDDMLKQLPEKDITLLKPPHTRYKGQLLGCDIGEMEGDFDAFLYVGDGLFHPKALAFKNKKPIFVYNPFTDELFELDKEETQKILGREKGALAKFYSSENIGVIVTKKPGQYFMNKADKLKEKYPEKNFYIFIADTLDFGELENYPFIDVFVNTMCPRIGLDDTNKMQKPVINADKLL